MVRPEIFLRNYMMSKADCGKVADDSEQFCPRLRHVLYSNVRDDSGCLVRHLANDFVRENLGLEWQLLLRVMLSTTWPRHGFVLFVGNFFLGKF